MWVEASHVGMRLLIVSLMAGLGLGCTPAEAPSPHTDVDLPDPEPEFISERTGPARCGALPVEATGPWQTEGERFEGVRRAWYPRPEYGRPIALRPATPPFAWTDYDFFQVEVVGTPDPVAPCYLPQSPPDDFTDMFECAPAWRMIHEAPREAWPSTPAQWAGLLGTLDHATAVFTSPEELRNCMPELPASVEASLPALGRRIDGETERVAFVERLDPDPQTTLVLAVVVSVEERRLTTEHQQLWLFEHPEAS